MTNLELIDRLCEIVEKQSEIIKKQAFYIEEVLTANNAVKEIFAADRAIVDDAVKSLR